MPDRSLPLLLALQRLTHLLLEAPDQPPPPPRLKAELEDQEDEHVDAHEAPRAPRAHAPDLVAPDLLLVIAAQDAGAQSVGRLLGDPLGVRQLGRRVLHGLLVAVVAAVQRREALQVRGRPGVLAREERGDFALGGGAVADRRLVGLAGEAHGFLAGVEMVLLGRDGGLEGFDAGVAGQVVEALRGVEDVALHVVHEVGEALGGCAAPGVAGGGELWRWLGLGLELGVGGGRGI